MEILHTLSSLIIIFFGGFSLYGYYTYRKMKTQFENKCKLFLCNNKKMEDMIEILKEQKPITDPIEEVQEEGSFIESVRCRLAAVTAGGNSKPYLGKLYTIEDIEKMKKEDIIKLYARYEAKLGQEITKSLVSCVISLYVKLVEYAYEVDDETDLIKDLKEDPFVTSALNSILCDMYYKFGNYLAPVAAALITTKHVKSKNYKTINKTENVDEQYITEL